METPWGDDGVDDSAYNEGCHHGVGFDEACEFCEDEEYDVLAEPQATAP